MKTIISMVGLSAIMLLGGCSSTKVTSSWKADNATGVKNERLLVLGIMNDKDRSMRIAMENELANDLREAGINATAASTVFSPKAFSDVKEERALKMLRNKGYDAVMTIVLLNKSKERSYVPGNVTYAPLGISYSRFFGYYRWMYGRIYEPGYYTTNTNYFWETNLYDLRNKALKYSVQSESFDPSSWQSLGKEYAKKITRDMMKQGLVKNIR